LIFYSKLDKKLSNLVALRISFGQAVFAAANEPKTMVTIQGQHNNGFIVSGDLYSKPVKKWLNAI
jgi:hypothetical protein